MIYLSQVSQNRELHIFAIELVVIMLYSISLMTLMILAAGTGLQVQVVASNSSSITKPPFYTKPSPLTLSCEVKGNSSGLYYNWTSTCLGSYFVSGKESDQVSTDSLELKDSGVHTCTACDDSGNCDSDSIPINVIGKFIVIPLVMS